VNLRSLRVLLAALAVVAWAPSTAVQAHVGTSDVFVDTSAGPYRILATVRPPRAIPGVAAVEILTRSDDVQRVRIVPLPLTGPGARFAPVPDSTSRSPDNPRLFTGDLWMMTAGAWQVRVSIDGAAGAGVTSVPVPTLPQATLEMSAGLRVLLTGLMLLLCTGFVAIVAALGREAGLEPGETADRRARRRGRIAGAVATIIVVIVVVLGNRWWGVEASSYARYVYKPLEAAASLSDDGRLALSLRDPGWISTRRIDDFVTDHGHPMHLFIVSPALDRLWHLHPSQTGFGTFEHALPEMPPGDYELFADVVHATGVSETVTGTFVNRGIRASRLTGDDSAWSSPSSGVSTNAAPLPGGGRIVWMRDTERLAAGRTTMFTFRVEDERGKPANDLELYMGMPGHAVFIERNRRVFAHVHPSGSVPMAAMEIGAKSLPETAAPVGDHLSHAMSVPAEISFPFGLPERGDYRIFVQVKRGGQVLTGAFDARVE
jgi:hypothetical protein